MPQENTYKKDNKPSGAGSMRFSFHDFASLGKEVIIYYKQIRVFKYIPNELSLFSPKFLNKKEQ